MKFFCIRRRAKKVDHAQTSATSEMKTQPYQHIPTDAENTQNLAASDTKPQPYRHVSTHAASDALSQLPPGAPAVDDKVAVKEQRTRCSHMGRMTSNLSIVTTVNQSIGSGSDQWSTTTTDQRRGQPVLQNTFVPPSQRSTGLSSRGESSSSRSDKSASASSSSSSSSLLLEIPIRKPRRARVKPLIAEQSLVAQGASLYRLTTALLDPPIEKSVTEGSPTLPTLEEGSVTDATSEFHPRLSNLKPTEPILQVPIHHQQSQNTLSAHQLVHRRSEPLLYHRRRCRQHASANIQGHPLQTQPIPHTAAGLPQSSSFHSAEPPKPPQPRSVPDFSKQRLRIPSIEPLVPTGKYYHLARANTSANLPHLRLRTTPSSPTLTADAKPFKTNMPSAYPQRRTSQATSRHRSSPSSPTIPSTDAVPMKIQMASAYPLISERQANAWQRPASAASGLRRRMSHDLRVSSY